MSVFYNHLDLWILVVLLLLVILPLMMKFISLLDNDPYKKRKARGVCTKKYKRDVVGHSTRIGFFSDPTHYYATFDIGKQKSMEFPVSKSMYETIYPGLKGRIVYQEKYLIDFGKRSTSQS